MTARSSAATEPDLSPLDFTTLFEVAEMKLHALTTLYPGSTPVFTQNGKWQLDDDAWAPMWTGGFLAGMLWILAERNGSDQMRALAEKYSLTLEPRKQDLGTHDIGFLFTPSWGRWHRLAPSARSRDVLVAAGRTMAGRFNSAGRYLRTWVDPGSTFIDVMMNVDIIYQAADLSDDPALRDIATQHALTSRRYLVRGDGSSVHEGWFDPQTGAFLRAETHQGYRSDSCWSRGQAWATYGFGSAYLRTGDHRFLDVARRCVDYYIATVGDRLVPPNDLDRIGIDHGYESSAASIFAAGALQLSECLGESGNEYRAYAGRVVAELSEPRFLASADPSWEGIVKHGIYHRRNGLGVDESVMWGEYYYLEALERLEKLSTAPDRTAIMGT